MINSLFFIIILAYLAVIFLIAYWAEKNANSKWVNNPYVYTLSMAVYCSAWTYYGSIGVATRSGIDFLPIYLGPVIAFPLWIVIMKRVIRISKENKISSIADFISLRYGNNRLLGAIITILCVMGIVPYISLQLKALSESFKTLVGDTTGLTTNIFFDSTFYIAVIIAIFVTFFGTRNKDASVNKKGIVFTTAIESLLKLIIFLIIGIYVTFFLFDGTSDIYEKISNRSDFIKHTKISGLEHGFSWMYMIMLSFMAIFLLPRQFHMSVIQNQREKHLKVAIWLFPLYLLLFNLFVIYISWAGILNLDPNSNPEYFTILLPLQEGNLFLALLVFIGGFASIISMIVVSTLALSIMVSNNLIIPYAYIHSFEENQQDINVTSIKLIRRLSIFFIIIFAYIFYIQFSTRSSLYSIGLISFVVIAQLAPSFFLGLFWNRGSSKGAITGILVGFTITFYTLIGPFTLDAFSNASSFIENGPVGIELLKPNALFGLDFLSPPAHSFFWSMVGNLLSYAIISVSFKGNYRERNHAEIFVNNKSLAHLGDDALIWRGEAYVADIKKVMTRFLGLEETENKLLQFFKKYELPQNTQLADARLINFAEKNLTGIIGSASARILVSNVVKEKEIALPELLEILQESKENIRTNRLLEKQSKELQILTDKLKEVNEDLILKDQQKDDFLDIIAHELKTPITGIMASSEILRDDYDELPNELKEKFLDNILTDTKRLTRLINNILDFEKISNGRETLIFQEYNFKASLETALEGVEQIARKKKIIIERHDFKDIYLQYDNDRIIQVITNILSNAVKFSDTDKGLIKISFGRKLNVLEVEITDNGTGIPEDEIPYVFDKFYQSKEQGRKKKIGSGLGLSISKHIIDKHEGDITLKNNKFGGLSVSFTLPING